MPEPRELTVLLELEREQERRFAGSLAGAERDAGGTPDRPSPKDTFAHVLGAKQRMHDALVALSEGAQPDSSHDRDEVVRAGAGRSFDSLEADAARLGSALAGDVEALDAGALGSTPAWIGEATLADEIIQQCVTHGMVLMFELMCDRGAAEEARGAQASLVAALPADVSPLQRSRALYNLACLDVRTGREEHAVHSLEEALRLRPALAEHVRDDPELEPVRARVLG
jgi:hypothetical protein